MKSILKFLAVVATVGTVGVAEGLTPDLRVKFNNGQSEESSIGSSSFYSLPLNVTAAKENGWTLETPAASYLADKLSMYCYPDQVYCVYYDDTEYIAGLQYAILTSNFTTNTFDWPTRGYTAWNDYWVTSQYFIDEVGLRTSKEDRLAERNSSRLLQYDSIWMTGFHGKIDRIPISASGISNSTAFIKQACYTWMGLHYYYNMTSNLECKAELFYPWFLLTDGDDLVGSGTINIGHMTLGDGQRNWYEAATSSLAREIISDGPEWIYDSADSPGLLTSHIYYVSDPREISC